MKHVTLSVSVPLVMPPRVLKQDILFKIVNCMLNNMFLIFKFKFGKFCGQ